MAIAPISALNVVSVSSAESKKVSNPIETKQPEMKQNTVAEGGALKSYFLGGNAATVSFGGFGVSTGGFITKKIDDVPCCCCGGRMVRASEMNEKAREFQNLKGEALADKIEEDKDFFRTPQRVVMMLAADEARAHGGDLARAKGAIGKGLKEKTQNYCINSLSEADAVVKAAYGEENPVSKLIASEVENLRGGQIARMPFTEKLNKVAEESDIDPVTMDTVLDAAMNIPANFDEVKKAYGQANGSPMSIARSLLEPSMQTIEHIHPKSLGGPNATQNFIAECKDCNNPRGNMSYAQWLKVHPEYPSKAQKHIEWFQQQVVDGKIDSRYDDYGTDVKKTLSKESYGAIELKVLNSDKIKELREAKKAGQEVSVSAEIAKQEAENEEKSEEVA
jgi:hypothetical protein